MLEKGFCRTRILLYTDRIFDSGLTRENTGYKKKREKHSGIFGAVQCKSTFDYIIQGYLVA